MFFFFILFGLDGAFFAFVLRCHARHGVLELHMGGSSSAHVLKARPIFATREMSELMSGPTLECRSTLQ